jgi:HPt (histidine-containing phosphotransfer) domain-containing protein
MSDSAPSSGQNEQLINWQAALEHAGGDRELLTDLVGIFLDESLNNLADIRKSLKDGDAKLLQRASHMLKGSLRIFESTRASELAFQLETMGREESLSGAPAVVPQLEDQLELVMAELRNGVPQ